MPDCPLYFGIFNNPGPYPRASVKLINHFDGQVIKWAARRNYFREEPQTGLSLALGHSCPWGSSSWGCCYCYQLAMCCLDLLPLWGTPEMLGRTSLRLQGRERGRRRAGERRTYGKSGLAPSSALKLPSTQGGMPGSETRRCFQPCPGGASAGLIYLKFSEGWVGLMPKTSELFLVCPSKHNSASKFLTPQV